MFPFFLVVLFFIIEFSFALNAYLAIDFASRDAALAGAEAGNDINADCSVLRAVERSIGAPADVKRVLAVRIFKSDANGNNTGPTNTYTRGGALPCPTSSDPRATLQWSMQGSAGYPVKTRCNELAGCGIANQRSVDTIGVEISYAYNVKTPVYSLLNSSGGGWTMTKGNAMRMEPVL